MKKDSKLKKASTNKFGPDPMSPQEKKIFFDFYKKNKSRRLFGFFNDLKKNKVNVSLLADYFRKKKEVNCLIVGCSHWANPVDLRNFILSFNGQLVVNIVALDVLPEALAEAISRKIQFLPLLTPAQKTPFFDEYFDITIADGLLNCCSFDQHEAIIQEMSRITKHKALILLGLAYAASNIVVKPAERPIAIYCRPLDSFRGLFEKYGFYFIKNSSINTSLWAGSEIGIDNCIASK